MEEQVFSAEYWDNRYREKNTPWQLNTHSPAFERWFLEVNPPKNSRILIPGGGNGLEALWLADQGYTNITVVDWSELVCEEQKARHKGKSIAWVCADFFGLKEQFDLILEQTFFCALPPSMRSAYFAKLPELLAPDGMLLGVMFRELPEGGPPFHCGKKDLEAGFGKYFSTVRIEACTYSIGPRQGNEWWVEVEGPLDRL
mgnify:CR=1 FL=1